jgi:predicted N-formylglutamate amidohydrolase
MKVVITCEHGGKQIPSAFRKLFIHASRRLNSHEGWDIGALKIAKTLSSLSDYFFYSQVSRLVVELNCSLHHRRLFSDFTKGLDNIQKAYILENYYSNYRDQVTEVIAHEIRNGNQVLHFSIHSFTPGLHHVVRLADIGLLFDSRRMGERNLCNQLKKEILNLNKNVIVRFNYPYLGKSDGFTTFLRKQFSEKEYLGFEIEINQYHLQNSKEIRQMKEVIYKSLKEVLMKY